MKSFLKSLKTPQGKLLLGLLIIIVILFAYYFYKMAKSPVVLEPTVNVSQTDHVRGLPGAKVSVVEFGDFVCPACSAYEPVVEKMLADNVDNVQLVFRHFPLIQIHRNALLGAISAEAAGEQGKFWEMHDILYGRQKEWSEALNARDFIIGYAKELKLDATKFSADLQSSAIEAKVRAEYEEALKLNLQGTPSFFINGKLIDNPASVEAFNKLVRDASK